jgi:dipeptidyl aminopeptidase/acylaminoacyl peptidase
MKFFGIAITLLAALVCTSVDATGVNVDAYIKKDRFNTIKISPTGEYYAATVPFEDRAALAILRRSDSKVMTTFGLGKNTYVAGFWWVNPQRVLISVAEKFGELDQPAETGELYAVNADGGSPDLLVGARAHGEGLGSRIVSKQVESVAATLIDDLPADDRHVLVAIRPFGDEDSRVDKMDVYTGRRTPVARGPVQWATFTADNSGTVRFAHGSNSDNSGKLYYREGEGKEWRLLNDELANDHDEWPIGFSADDRTAYLEVEQAAGPNALVAMDIANGVRKQLMRDEVADPAVIIYRDGTSIPLGAWFDAGKASIRFFDDSAPEAKLQRSLEAAFAGSAVAVTSRTADGKLALVQVWNDQNPGDFYIFDTTSKKADFLLARRDWFDPSDMAQVRPVALTSRDGTPLHGYLTLPHGSNGKNLPTVILPHGGPFKIRDVWGFDNEAQMLSSAGYAVLQLNYRGSSGYGRAFTQAGAKEWGGKMQDDLTDATHWAVQNGYADANRICIYGASYGAYAALMGAAKEPMLYKCAAGYVGVYDLPSVKAALKGTAGKTWSSEWIGNDDKIVAVSPNRIAEHIKVPVFLAAGGDDERAPIAHSKMMEKALRKAGVPVETLYYSTEGHGFYTHDHQLEFYTRLLAFLNHNIGGATAVASVTTGSSASGK